jgi:hypothetical protein
MVVLPNHPSLIGCSIIINHPFWGTTILGNYQMFVFSSTKLRIEPDEPENIGAAAAYPNLWEFKIPCLTHQ